MPEKLPATPEALSAHYQRLRMKRKRMKARTKQAGAKRGALTPKQRATVLAKTDGRCHLCGGKIDGPWQADHVLAHMGGGKHTVDNYLPAHSLCNNYRWHYTAEEFQQILKLGVWARTQIDKFTLIGRLIAEAFLKHEKRRSTRSS
jgi:5-methylcytosine-specific restriction endonuclease McrA